MPCLAMECKAVPRQEKPDMVGPSPRAQAQNDPKHEKQAGIHLRSMTQPISKILQLERSPPGNRPGLDDSFGLDWTTVSARRFLWKEIEGRDAGHLFFGRALSGLRASLVCRGLVLKAARVRTQRSRVQFPGRARSVVFWK